MAYESLAKVYDKIMREDVDYGEWARYTDSLFCESGIRGNKILDLGCGTGGITLEMSKLGREMSGVDISEEMIAEAKKKFAAENIEREALSAGYFSAYSRGEVSWGDGDL